MNIIKYLGTGYSHEIKNKPCQDYANYYIPEKDSKTNNIVLALSDGCSSSEAAEHASVCNVSAIIDYFQTISLSDFLNNFTPEKQKQELLNGCLEYFACAEEITGIVGRRNYCATLVFAVISEQDDLVLIGHVGDGAAICFDKDNAIVYSSEPENGSASNKTFFTVENDPTHFYLSQISYHDVEQIMLCSDGMSGLIERYGNYHQNEKLSEIARNVLNNEVDNCHKMANMLIQLTSGMGDHTDDWSVLFFNKHQEQCHDFFKYPVSMRVELLCKNDVVSLEQRKDYQIKYYGRTINDINDCFVTIKKAEDGIEYIKIDEEPLSDAAPEPSNQSIDGQNDLEHSPQDSIPEPFGDAIETETADEAGKNAAGTENKEAKAVSVPAETNALPMKEPSYDTVSSNRSKNASYNYAQRTNRDSRFVTVMSRVIESFRFF